MSNYHSVTNNQLYEALFLFINNVASFDGLPFSRADEGVSPTGQQYGVVNVIGSKEIAQPEVSYSELPSKLLEENVRGWFEKTVSIRIFRDSNLLDAVDILEDIMLYLKTSRVQQQLSDSGVGFVRSSNIRQTSVETKGAREKRAQVDLVFNVYKAVTSDIEQIEIVEVDGCTVVDGEQAKPRYINTIQRSP